MGAADDYLEHGGELVEASPWEIAAEERREREDQIARERRAELKRILGELVEAESARDQSADYHPSKFTAPARAEYLLQLQTHGGSAKAAQSVGVTPSLVKTYGARVPDFRQAEREALAIYRDSLSAEVHRRAVEGVSQLRFNRNGEPIGEAVTYSDGLLGKALDRADRIVGDLPKDEGLGAYGKLDATLVQKLSPEGRRALRIVLGELAGLVPTAEDMQVEGIPPVVDVQGGGSE